MKDLKVKVELSVEQVNIILQGLLELPAKFSIGLIDVIKQQVEPQIPKQSTPPAPTEG